jgi:hypothetical protein
MRFLERLPSTGGIPKRTQVPTFLVVDFLVHEPNGLKATFGHMVLALRPKARATIVPLSCHYSDAHPLKGWGGVRGRL